MSLLYANAIALIRANLAAIEQNDPKNKAKAVVIGQFTQQQFSAINAQKVAQGLPQLESPEIVFIGLHMYRSRVVKDGYSVDDLVQQIEGALMDTSSVVNGNMTAIQSIALRPDGYGNMVKDEAVFECTQRKPRAEFYSVVPKGDQKKPPKNAQPK